MIENFLDEIIVDFYCKMREISDGLSKDEIDELFFDFDGKELSDKDFINEHIEGIDEVIIDEVYIFAKETCGEWDISLRTLVVFLAKKLLLFSYKNHKSNMLCYLKNTSIDKMVNLFKENDEFGRFMIASYIEVMLKSDEYKKTKEELKNDKELYNAFLYFEKEETYVSVQTINEILRGVICNLYDYYILNACDEPAALNNVWAYFTNNFDTLDELDKMGANQNEKAIYKKWMLNLIYADVFESIQARKVEMVSLEDLADIFSLDVLVLYSVSSNQITIPKDKKIRNLLLKKFILLTQNQEIFKNNRKNTYATGNIEVLKKVNPTYKLDELTLH